MRVKRNTKEGTNKGGDLLTRVASGKAAKCQRARDVAGPVKHVRC